MSRCVAVLAFAACGGGAGGGAPADAGPDGVRDAGPDIEAPDAAVPAFFAEVPPPMGELTIVALGGETLARKHLAASLQGVVNRDEVRLYVVDGDADGKRWWEAEGEEASQRFWLERYAEDRGVEVGDEVALDEALARFSGEVAGYVLAGEDEPWTISAATTLAGQRGALVAVGDEVAAVLDALGLSALDDLRGRWGTNDTCIRETFEKLGAGANPLALGILAPTEYRLRDFLVQNAIFTAYARPGAEGWDALRDMLDATPPDLPVMGYLSLTGGEEFLAVTAISRAGKFLVPSDTTANLSVHRSVGADLGEPLPVPLPVGDAPCAKGSLRVAIAISDGDNLAIPLNRYVSDAYWLAGDRGDFAIGWSCSPALAWLAPAAAAHYAATRADADEIVGMLGIGYAYPTEMADPALFFEFGRGALARLGMTSWWHLDVGLYDLAAPAWQPIDDAWRAGAIRGALLGYFALGPTEPLATAGGMPVLPAGNLYEDTPADVEARVRDALTAYRGGGPDALFVSASVWSNDFAGLADVMRALEVEDDLAFLTPAQLLGCLASK